MFKRIISKICLACLLILPTLAFSSIPEIVKSFPSLPVHFREAQFKEIQAGIDQRATLFLKGRQFHAWRANRPDKEIQDEFNRMNDWRLHTWYVDPNATTLVSREDFMIAQDLLEKGYYRQPQMIAFQYNQTDATYNSSSIILNGIKFLALESPSEKTFRNFFNLLINHQVTQVVRISSADDQLIPDKPVTYWKNKLKKSPDGADILLNVPQGAFNANPYPILYYTIDSFGKEKTLNPKELLKVVQSVRKNFDPTSGLLACHCATGSDKTGTFLAALVLISEIEKQKTAFPKKSVDVSIEKIVMQLALQRPYMVLNKEQYITLYRLVDLYMQMQLNSNKNSNKK